MKSHFNYKQYYRVLYSTIIIMISKPGIDCFARHYSPE